MQIRLKVTMSLPRHSPRVLLAISLALLLSCPAEQELTAFERDCRAWCGKPYHCGVDPDYDPEVSACVDRCEDEYEIEAVDLGTMCEAAYKAVMACMADLECNEWATFVPSTDPGEPCGEEVTPFFMLCPGVYFAPE